MKQLPPSQAHGKKDSGAPLMSCSLSKEKKTVLFQQKGKGNKGGRK